MRNSALPQDIDIKNFIPHYQYYDTVLTNYYDKNYVRSACLPPVDDNDFQDFLAPGRSRPNETSTSGSSHLLKVKLVRLDNDKCFDKLRREHLQNGLNNRTKCMYDAFG
uniref:Uncharacterized protein n=1 Tax=Glossina palpalis gambiensis TaxID=67801 RepID=A0A1B0ATS8_9MUSC